MAWIRRGLLRRLLLLFFFVLDPCGLFCHGLGPRQLRHTAAKFSGREMPDGPCFGSNSTCRTPVVAGAAGFVQPSPLQERSGQRSSWELRLEPLLDLYSLPEVCLLPLFRSSSKASGEVCCSLQCLPSLEERSGQRSSWELRLEPLLDLYSLPEVCLLPLFRSSSKASGEVCCSLQCLALKFRWSFTLWA